MCAFHLFKLVFLLIDQDRLHDEIVRQNEDKLNMFVTFEKKTHAADVQPPPPPPFSLTFSLRMHLNLFMIA